MRRRINIREARDKAREAIKRIKEGKPPFPPPEKLDSFATVAKDWLTRSLSPQLCWGD